MMIRGYEIGARVIVVCIIAVMLVVAVLFGTSQCTQRRSADKQAEVSKGQGQASVGAGEEALNTTSNIVKSDAETDAMVASGQAEIKAAPKGQKGAAAKRAACRLKAYRDTPQCKEPTP